MRATLRLLLSASFLVAACNTDPNVQSAPGSTGGSGASNGAGGSGDSSGSTGGSGGAGTGGSGQGGTAGAPMRPPSGGAGGAGGTAGNSGQQTCSSTSAMAKPVPVDIFILLDRSHSMTERIDGRSGGRRMMMDAGAVPTKWESMRMALTNFLQSPSSAGLNVGFGYFPHDGDQCDVAGYANPAIPVAALPGVAMPILDWINMSEPPQDAQTPTLPALTGVVQYAQQREMMTGRRTAIALATDGQPNACNSNVAAVSAVAAMAAAKGIFTFVIGVGPSLQNLNAIATAGGTKMAYQADMATPDQLAAAFKAVQTQASKLACSFMIPPPPSGQTLDPNKVNVRFTPTANAGGAFDVGRVANHDACGMQGGWYYDDPMNPRTVNLCDTTCAKVNDSGEGSLAVLFGCKGIVIQ